MYLVIEIVLAFIVSFWKDNRSLWNPVLFLLSLISSYFYLSYLFYKNGYENVQLAFYVFAFVLLPFLLFLSGIFLIDLFGNCKKCYTIFMETVYDKAQKLNSKNFKLLIGVKKETFQLMLEHLNSAYQIQHRKGGRPRSLPMEDQLIMTLRYLRYYPTQRLLAFDFGVGVATVNAIITWVEDTLRASGSFDLDHLEAPSAAVAIDVTESPIQRPKKTKAKIILVKRNDTP
ncbi:Mobile element protein [Streptococcus pneumoniae]|nr:Mobile element protein [Streptococcus pneumoniae]VMH17473.1 transposase-like protein, IS1515 [Streptococcus pneumoniae]VNY66774.1 transposase-like protein, IS1515 [Streptococcus pneumoniae]VRR00517.1 transposase-like protein, IS1515 [Streptococcus pneumoniae]